MLQDVRFAWRAMRRSPGFTALGVMILALGIGTTTAIFSVVEAVLLRPLPYGVPSRLVAISRLNPRAVRPESRVSLTDVEEWRQRTHQLSGIGSFVYTRQPVAIGDQTLSLVTAAVDPELLTTLGTPPVLGANFAGGGSSHPDQSAILSYRLWRDALNEDTQAVGRAISVDGKTYTVAGVLSESFQFPRADASYFDDAVDLLIPVANIAQSWGPASSQWFAIGRLTDGATAAQAESELGAIAAHLASPGSTTLPVHVSSLAEQTTKQVRPALLLILSSSGVLLLIACVNVMNLWFSRGAARGREIAIRKAVGAGMGRIVRQLLTESLCLTLAAGAIGMLLARALQRVIASTSPVHLPLSGRIGIDGRVVAFAIGLSAIAAIVSGLLPALHVSFGREHLVGGTGTRSTRGRVLANIQRALTVAQVALGLALLTAAGHCSSTASGA